MWIPDAQSTKGRQKFEMLGLVKQETPLKSKYIASTLVARKYRNDLLKSKSREE